MITNANVMTTDYAKEARQSMLKSYRPKAHQSVMIAPGMPAAGVWNEDVSGSDLRSVKAYLRGAYSFRTIWWNVFSAVHQRVSKSGSLESAMYDFHRLHHALTFFKLRKQNEFYSLHNEIKGDGATKAGAAYVFETFKRM